MHMHDRPVTADNPHEVILPSEIPDAMRHTVNGFKVTGRRQSKLAKDVYEQASIQYHSIRHLAAYTTPRAGLSLWHMLYPLKETNRRLS